MTLFITPNGRIFRSSSRAAGAAAAQPAPRQQAEYDVVVPLDVKAEDNDYVITALLPGMKADDLSIQVHNETLTIQGELKSEVEENSKFLMRELPVGRFYRTIRLPEKLDSTRAVADLNDGILTLRLPKAEEALPKTIKVSVN